MTDAVAISLISSVTSAITAVMVAFIAQKQSVIHKQIDGQQDKLIKIEKRVSRDQGNKEGREELLDEQDTNPST